MRQHQAHQQRLLMTAALSAVFLLVGKRHSLRILMRTLMTTTNHLPSIIQITNTLGAWVSPYELGGAGPVGPMGDKGDKVIRGTKEMTDLSDCQELMRRLIQESRIKFHYFMSQAMVI